MGKTVVMATLINVNHISVYLLDVLDSSPDCAGDAPAEYTFLLGSVRALSAKQFLKNVYLQLY